MQDNELNTVPVGVGPTAPIYSPQPKKTIHWLHILAISCIAAAIGVGVLAYRVVSTNSFSLVNDNLASMTKTQAVDAVSQLAHVGSGEWQLTQTKQGYSYSVQQVTGTAQTTSTNLHAGTASIVPSLAINPTVVTSAEWRLKAQATPLSNQSQPANFSLIFDYTDILNYSYVNYSSADGAGLSGIYQVKAGVTHQLASFSTHVQAGQNYKAEIRMYTDNVRAYVNGHFLARIPYTQSTTSQIGVGTINGNANFTSLELEESSTSTPLPTPTPTPTTAPVTNPTPAPTNTTPTPTSTPSPTPSTPTPTPAPSTPTSTTSAPTGNGRNVTVTNSAQLASALANATPGDVITMADGTYTGSVSLGGKGAAFGTTVAGTASTPITLQGSSKAIIDAGNTSSKYGLYLLGANYWVISGITVRDASKGIVLDSSNHNTITGVTVTSIGDEGIHFRSASSDNVLSNSTINHTGQVQPGYGEGVYLGSAKSNWGTYSNGLPDKSDRNQIINNNISYTGSENLDIKEGTTGGVVTNNHFDGTGMSGQNYADSWVDVKGNSYTFSGNSGISSINDGIQIHTVVSGWGDNNVFQNNTLAVNGPGYGFNVQSTSVGNVIYCNNSVTGAVKGFGNVACKQ